MMAIGLILLGYAGVLAAFGWYGLVGIALHVGLMLLATWRKK